MAQSGGRGPRAGIDSVAVARQYMANATAVLDSLTALHFARLRESSLNRRLRRAEGQRDSLTMELGQTNRTMMQAQQQRLDGMALTGQYRQKHRRNQVELWAWRLVATYVIYRKMCPSCPL